MANRLFDDSTAWREAARLALGVGCITPASIQEWMRDNTPNVTPPSTPTLIAFLRKQKIVYDKEKGWIHG